MLSLRNAVKNKKRFCVSVAAANDLQVLISVKMIYEQGIAEAILVGDKEEILKLNKEVGLPDDIKIVDVKDPEEAAHKAVSFVHEGKADILLKGLVNTSDFLRAVLNKEYGLRTGSRLSHMVALEIPGHHKLIFATDGGMNVAPDIEAKTDIIKNALNALKQIGINKPKVAILTANEKVDPSMQATIDAENLVKIFENDSEFKGIIEGPIAADVAFSPEHAKHKGIESAISGDVDLLIFPNIEAGNIFCKTLDYFVDCKIAGAILGPSSPVIMLSRADNSEAKLNSIALGCLISK